jgi:hypothetical protein
MVHEGLAWFSGKGVKTYDQSVVVGPPPYYGGSMDVSKTPASMPTQLTTTVPLRVQNLSNFQWDTTVNLAYHWYDSAGKAVVWDGLRTPLAGLKPSEVRAVDAAVLPPAVPGVYTLRFDVVREGVTWFSGQGMQLAPIAVKVDVPGYGALYAAPATVSGPPNATIVVTVLVTNVGTLVWQPRVHFLAYHIYAASGNVYVWDGQRTPLVAQVGAGRSAVLNATVKLPPTAGSWTITLDLVQEGLTWFSGQGVPMESAALVVQ